MWARRSRRGALQPGESAPPEFRTMLRARLRRYARVAAIRPWLMVPAAAAAAAPVWAGVPGGLPPAASRPAGARIAEAGERKAAHVLYEKGRTLLSVFTVPVAGREGELSGTRVSYRGRDYVTQERKGSRTVSWTEGQVVFGLVSMLDYDSILQCADTLRSERSRQARLEPPP